jgi:glycerophosphoryl diester phosphodiesterase
VWVVAHRGASGHAPENTLAAFRRAVELGAGFIETDLRLTRDAHFVAVHDDTLERTTSGTGAVYEHTLAELRQLDAGAWFGSEFAGEKIPTLEEILALARRADVVFYLELKPGGAWGAEHALVGALRQAEELARVVVLSFDHGMLGALRKLEQTLMTGLLVETPDQDPIALATSSGARQLAVKADLVTPGLLSEARRADLALLAWTVNHPAHMRALAEAGVDGIITDYPDRLLSTKKKKN